MKAAAVILAILALHGSAPGQTSTLASLFPPQQLARIQQGIRDIYDLKFDRAEQTFQSMIRESPDDPAGYAYLAMTFWVQELSNTQELSIDRFAASDFFSEEAKAVPNIDPAREARFRQASQEAIDRARDRLAKNSSDRLALFLLGLAYQNIASYEGALKRSWWQAFRMGVKTYNYHDQLLRRDSNFHDARLTIGAYNYVAASLKRSIRWIAILMGHVGSKERGKADLELAAEKGVLVADDARITLSLIYAREKNYSKSYQYLEQLLKRHPDNYLVHLDMAGMALLMRQHDRAVALYRDILKQHPDVERGLVYNRIGVALREKDDHPGAISWFARTLADSASSPRSLTIARLERAKTLDLMGQRQEALKVYRAVVDAPDVAGSRKEAASLMHEPYRGGANGAR